MNKIIDIIELYPAIPIYYNDDKDTCIEILKACYEGGIRVLEFVNRGNKAKQNFVALLQYKNKHFPDLKLGIGTIKTVEQTREFVGLGAEFIVSPIVVSEIAAETLAKGILWIPGCMTPTEIALAAQLKAPLVKLFPGDTLGPKFLKAIKPLFPDVKFMPTGGVGIEKTDLDIWFEAGVFSVGLGSKLFTPPQDASDYGWLVERVNTIMGHVKR